MPYTDHRIKAAVLLGIAIAIVLMLILAGCGTHYHIEKKPDGSIVADTRSSRSYEYFDLAYNPTTGMFRVIAVGVTDDTAKIVEVAVGGLENVIVSSLVMPGQNASSAEWDSYITSHNAAVNEAIKTN
jgi:hypothetical protein